MPLHSRLLSWSPSVRVTPNQIVVRTSIWFQVLNLGTFMRQVDIDSRTRTVRINGRFFWFFRSLRTIAFNEIKGVLYGYNEAGATASYISGESEGSESFPVGLRLRTMEEVPLFTFSGEGEYIQQTTDIWDIPRGMIETALDTAGTQQEDSLDFVDLLCGRLGVPLDL